MLCDMLGELPDKMSKQPEQTDIKPQEVTIEGWVARDESGGLYLYWGKPYRGTLEWHTSYNTPRQLPQESFPEVTWDSEPKRVKITITPIEE